MKLLSEALAGEMQARLIRSVEVVEGDSVIGEEAKGTRLLVSGTVEEACWSRSRSGGGSYRLKVALSAAVVRRNAPNLQGFWTKTVEIDEPHRGRAAQDMAAMLAKAFGGAAEELGKALEKQPAAEALAQAGE
jgi:hypothetical protein